MANVLVCIKRVPDLGGEITLTPDGMSVDDSSLGHTVSPHEDCAVELAVQTARDTDGEATVLTLGSADAVEQLRHALALGCTRAVLVEADAAAHGPADVAAAIADVVRAHQAAGTTYDLVLLGNDASDTGDFQVGVRLAYLLDRPVVAGVSTLGVSGDFVTARGERAGRRRRGLRRRAAGGPDDPRGWRRAALPVGAGTHEGQEGGDRGDRTDA